MFQVTCLYFCCHGRYSTEHVSVQHVCGLIARRDAWSGYSRQLVPSFNFRAAIQGSRLLCQTEHSLLFFVFFFNHHLPWFLFENQKVPWRFLWPSSYHYIKVDRIIILNGRDIRHEDSHVMSESDESMRPRCRDIRCVLCKMLHCCVFCHVPMIRNLGNNLLIAFGHNSSYMALPQLWRVADKLLQMLQTQDKWLLWVFWAIWQSCKTSKHRSHIIG